MKVAVTGKGGVGKTTLVATMAYVLAERGYDVLAVDADPDANLASALGVSPEEAAEPVPIAAMRELVTERTGAEPGSFGSFFRMNPRVDDLPERLSLPVRGVRLMVMGTVKQGAGGCVCPESVLLRTLVRHLLLRSHEAVILDMEAGIEHLGRATASGVDAMLIVVEPGARSARTALAIRELARDIGIGRLFVVLNKVDGSGRAAVEGLLYGLEIIGELPLSDAVQGADLREEAPYDVAPDYVAAVRLAVDALVDRLAAG